MSSNFSLLLAAIFSVCFFGMNLNAIAGEPEVEVGSIQWGRDLAQAKQTSSESGKPLMLLFQEVPG